MTKPNCQSPHHRGKKMLGNVVDHIEPHKGDSGPKQSEEQSGVGFDYGCDERGYPLDPFHAWNIGATIH